MKYLVYLCSFGSQSYHAIAKLFVTSLRKHYDGDCLIISDTPCETELAENWILDTNVHKFDTPNLARFYLKHWPLLSTRGYTDCFYFDADQLMINNFTNILPSSYSDVLVCSDSALGKVHWFKHEILLNSPWFKKLWGLYFTDYELKKEYSWQVGLNSGFFGFKINDIEILDLWRLTRTYTRRARNIGKTNDQTALNFLVNNQQLSATLMPLQFMITLFGANESDIATVDKEQTCLLHFSGQPNRLELMTKWFNHFYG